MKKFYAYLLAFAFFLGGGMSAAVKGQGSAEYGSGLKFNLNPEGTKYMRLIMWNQIWFRHTQMNPGTTVNGTPASTATDVGARRLRMLAYAQITPRYLILMHFGINNQTFVNGGAAGTSGTGGYGQGKKPGLFFHDVWNEYAVVPTKDPLTGKVNKATLAVGAGLHYWHGISRMTSASTLNFLAVDAPIFNWPLIENSDQFARLFGIYAKGKIGKLEYRLNYNKPFATNLTPPTNGTTVVQNVAVDNNGVSKMSYGGYFEYQFLDQEANVLPFKVGTYIGTKQVLNIGAGFYHQPDGTQSVRNGLTRKHDISLFAVDLFADLPFGNKDKNMAVTTYSTLYKYNFGPNYLRNLGIMNEGATDPKFMDRRSLSGPGNARPMIGTGTIWYTQAGLLLPKGDKSKVRVQPFAAYAVKDFEALGKTGNYYDMGCNFYIDGHHAKITPQYSTRPVYLDANTISGSKGEFILQAQIYL
ncbi:porin [Tellurirhabdus rosea]|uniref:porin n=1 Tax=Tellurirhabdus rosea TaxID=2674997 RepID=UPI00225A291E|nr:porin [Tellurirhabdus rosea]